MSNKLSTIKERILYLAENIEVSKQEFFKKIGITYGNFTGDKKKRPLNSDAIENILRIYPQTNPGWLLTGRGSMLLEDIPKIKKIADTDNRDQYIMDLQQKHIEKLEQEIIRLKKERKSSTDYNIAAEPKQ